MDLIRRLIVKPNAKVDLAKYDSDDTLGWSHDKKTEEKLEKTLKRLDDLQYPLYAGKKHALLVVLQGMDAGGKDGTIRHVMSGLNPCRAAVSPLSNSQPRWNWRMISFGASTPTFRSAV